MNIVINTENIMFFAIHCIEELGEDKSHDKMMSAYLKSYGYKSFLSTLIQKGIVFKLFHSKKFRFRGSFYVDTSVLVWMEGVPVTIKLHFQIYLA